MTGAKSPCGKWRSAMIPETEQDQGNINKRQLLPKVSRDWAIIAGMLCLLIAAFYGLRYLDPSATVDGLGGIYLALQQLIIGFAAATLAATIRWLIFYPLRRSEELGLMTQWETPGYRGLAVVALDRLTWFAIWFVLFSQAA